LSWVEISWFFYKVFFPPKYLQDLCQHTCSRYKISMTPTEFKRQKCWQLCTSFQDKVGY
jgi:hypothetical protein